MILRTGRMECTSDELAETFQQESNTFLCKVQMLWKSTYTFQWTTNFSWNFVCTRGLPFWQLCQNFWAKHGRNSFSNIEFDEKIQNCRNKVSKLCSKKRKRSHVNSAEPRLSVVKIISSPSPTGCEKLCFCGKLVSLQTDASIRECSFDKIAKNFTP